MNLNIDSKSQLAKLLATENITIQHNNVATASFNLEDRVLTIPVFKNPRGAVYDMLIAHEVSHALNTPAEEWKNCLNGDNNLLDIKDYINVIEDVRIDKLIQKKYPGVVQDYKDGFNILWNDDFFNVRNKNLNTELMLIDKINLYFKSSKQLDSIKFSNEDKLFVDLVDSCKTFKDVIEAAKKLSDWQKKQNESLKKLPDFDSHPLVKMYGEQEKSEEEDDENSQSNSDSKSSDQNNEQEKSDSDSQNEPTKSEDATKENGDGSKETEGEKENSEDKSDKVKNQYGNPDGAGGDNVKINMPLKSITQNNIDNSIKQRYVDGESRGYNYFQIPDANLDEIVYSNKNWLKVNNEYMVKHHSKNAINQNFEEYKKFKRDSKATISYLVKEFEMKKSAEGYKRQTTDKTGIIDPLKLHKYKISEDIFKRLSVIPDAKNHGMILLLDWSGSMSNCIGKTVDQLLQLVWFCKQINIPFKVYFFSDRIQNASWNERRFDAKENKKTCFKFKAGDSVFEAFNLVEIANHTIKKQKLDQSLFYLYAYGKYYNDNYSYRRNLEYIERLYPPSEFHLSSTPLNEALATMYKIIPLFKTKYQVSKLSLITLTDGHSNRDNKGNFMTVDGVVREMPERGYGSQGILKLSKGKEIKGQGGTTGLLLTGLKKKFGITTIGFFILKSSRRWEFDRYALSQRQHKLSWELQDQIKLKVRAEYNKHKAASVEAYGYNEFYLINGKDMQVQNANLDEIKEDAKKGDIRRAFSKSMKQRTVSRVLLNKFIKQVA